MSDKTGGRASVPPRGGEGGALEDLFEGARADGFTPGEMNELSSRLGVATAAPGARQGPGAGPAPSPVAVAGAGVKTLAGLLLAAGVVVAGATAHFWPSAARAPTAPSVVATPVQATGPEVPPSVVGPAEPGPPVVAVTDLPSASGSVRAVAPARAPAAIPAVIQAPGPVATLDRGASGASGPTTGASANEVTVSGNASSSPGASLRADETMATPVLDPAPTEATLLLRARRELSADPAGALALTQEAARAFPAGALAPEGDVLAIEALARLGRMSEASTRLGAFRQRYPGSLHIARLQALIRP
jgi:hypothetical protein